MIFPKHHSLEISHNYHKQCYEKIEVYLKRHYLEDTLSFHDYNKCIELDEIWECRLFTHSPIGYIHIVVPTWERLLEDLVKNA